MQRNGSQIPLGNVTILGQGKPEPTDDQKLLGTMSMLAQFKTSLELAQKDAKDVLMNVSLNPHEADALRTYQKMLEDGYEQVKRLHASVLVRATKPFLKQMAENFAAVKQVLATLPEVDVGEETK